MSLTYLEIQNFRNLTANVSLGPSFNILYGKNGSGKTSFLEAIHYLGLARSFRTHLNHRVINHNSDNFSLFAKIQQGEIEIPIGISRSRNNGEGEIRINGKSADSALELAKIFPLQFINSEAHLLLSGGPKYRRQFLDWGLFHVEHSFLSYWQRAYRSLKQRNAALRTRASRDQTRLWDAELTAAGYELNRLREKYIKAFETVFLDTLKILLENVGITLSYYQGWPAGRDLGEVLSESFERDLELGRSQFGPHRADLLLRINNIPAQDTLSQGQQKLVVYAMRLAQGIMLSRQTEKDCIYLIDDLPAELDHEKQRQVAEVLRSLETQVFVTGIENERLETLFLKNETKLFHVEHGFVEDVRM
jgi:DNA replication and repair protein RecF